MNTEVNTEVTEPKRFLGMKPRTWGIVLAVTVVFGIVSGVTGDDDTTSTTTTASSNAAAVVEAEATDVPSWVNAESIAWSDEVVNLLDESTDLADDLAVAMGNEDIATATTASVDLYLLWLDAPDAPSDDIPVADEYNALRASVIETFDVMSDALIEFDVDKLERSIGMVDDTVALTTVFTDALDEATAELDALN